MFRHTSRSVCRRMPPVHRPISSLVGIDSCALTDKALADALVSLAISKFVRGSLLTLGGRLIPICSTPLCKRAPAACWRRSKRTASRWYGFSAFAVLLFCFRRFRKVLKTRCRPFSSGRCNTTCSRLRTFSLRCATPRRCVAARRKRLRVSIFLNVAAGHEDGPVHQAVQRRSTNAGRLWCNVFPDRNRQLVVSKRRSAPNASRGGLRGLGSHLGALRQRHGALLALVVYFV